MEDAGRVNRQAGLPLNLDALGSRKLSKANYYSPFGRFSLMLSSKYTIQKLGFLIGLVTVRMKVAFHSNFRMKV